MKRLVIIPAKNEHKSIKKTLEQVKGLDVVVCDGGSKDKTIKIAEGLGFKVLRCKSGYGKVILEGFKYGLEKGYDQFIVMDCESHTYKEIIGFLDCGADVIAGLRKNEKKPWYRKVITHIGRNMRPQGVSTEIVDISNGFRAYSRKFVEYLMTIKDLPQTPSYTFNSIVAFYSEGWKVEQFPMSYIGGKSGLNAWELLKAWNWRVNYKMQKEPEPEIEYTLEDVVGYLKLYQRPQFQMYVKRKRERDEH